MKWAWLVMGLLLTGCATVSDVEKSPETMSVISGKSPTEFSDCLLEKLKTSRKPSTVTPHKDGFVVIVPQKFTSGPAAVIFIDQRSSGSAIKVHEHLQNMPLRPGDVPRAVSACISG